MPATSAAAIAANRFGLGSRPQELALIGNDPRGWLGAQLTGSAPEVRGAGLRPSAEILAQAVQLRKSAVRARNPAARRP